MQIQIPQPSRTIKGLLFLVSGIVLFLHVTNLVRMGLNTVIFLASLALIFYGLLEMNAYNKLMACMKKK